MDIVLWVVVIAVMVGFFVLVNRKGMTAESKRKVSRWFFIGMVVVLAVF
ncbi:MAG: hypothetical protein H7146_02460, partial [Burkholderiaceae bacterium]|nr:hypothetical protein [Microbacteriaceae bacterium]